MLNPKDVRIPSIPSYYSFSLNCVGSSPEHLIHKKEFKQLNMWVVIQNYLPPQFYQIGASALRLLMWFEGMRRHVKTVFGVLYFELFVNIFILIRETKARRMV